MKEVSGKYTNAVIFTDDVEDYSLAQIKNLCENEVFKDSKIRIMPDVHPGKVTPIGFTVETIGEKIMPSIIGTDIGCGILLAKIKPKKRLELEKLDKVIKENIPCGSKIHDNKCMYIGAIHFDLNALYCKDVINTDKTLASIRTLGGGNHFIELDKDDEGNLYLCIHTGSRHLGVEVTEYYLNEGQKQLKKKGINIPYELTYLEGELRDKYLNDISIVTQYAFDNRNCILNCILRLMKWNLDYQIDCRHNFINYAWYYPYPKFIRKGSISALKDEDIIIPINMRDGIILGKGLGNSDWNYSAPHGAGRIMNRTSVKDNFTVSQFKKEMKGIYCSCIGKDTLDEAPFAYRNLEYVLESIKDTVKVEKILKPIYNFKAGGKE